MKNIAKTLVNSNNFNNEFKDLLDKKVTSIENNFSFPLLSKLFIKKEILALKELCIELLKDFCINLEYPEKK